jgi:fibronectin-binding autotransporter adhesin
LSGPGSVTGATTDAGQILGATVSGTLTVSSGGLVSGGSIVGAATATILSGGVAEGVTVSSGGSLVVDGVASAATVSSGGKETIAAGGTASGATVSSGGYLIDNGSAIFSGSTAITLAGTLSGAGTITEEGTGSLVISGVASAFAGSVVISGGTVELATAGGVGKSSVTFASTAASATLQIDAADSPPAGSTFSSTLSNFDQTFDGLDLRGVAFVSGATAVVSGSTLVVTNGGETYDFKLAGTLGASYKVTSDGHGGTLVNDPPKAEAAFAQAFSLLTDSVTWNFVESHGLFGASGDAQSGRELDLAAVHNPHG